MGRVWADEWFGMRGSSSAALRDRASARRVGAGGALHPTVFSEFDRLCRARGAGGAVLEVGAVPSAESLLTLPALAGATSKVGVSLEPPSRFADFEIRRVAAGDLGGFADASFDTLLCNSVLEHDPRFWRTLSEMRRVARPGALVAIGVPGYGPRRRSRTMRLLGTIGRLAPLRRSLGAWAGSRLASVPTLLIHRFPGDYYRFSEHAVREVLLEGLEDVEVRRVYDPPRFVGSGRVPRRP